MACTHLLAHVMRLACVVQSSYCYHGLHLQVAKDTAAGAAAGAVAGAVGVGVAAVAPAAALPLLGAVAMTGAVAGGLLVLHRGRHALVEIVEAVKAVREEQPGDK